MRLYGYWISSCTYRVRIALELKALPYEVVPVNLRRDGGEQNAAGFEDRNPMRQVPVLEVDIGGAPVELGQSVAILEYLEETHPEPPLLPADPVLRARVRQLTEIVNAGIQPYQNLSLTQRLKRDFDADITAWCADHVLRGLKAYEAIATTTSGRFSVGDAPTFADCALIPQVLNARRFGIDVERELPTLHGIDLRANELDAFVAAHPDRQPDAGS